MLPAHHTYRLGDAETMKHPCEPDGGTPMRMYELWRVSPRQELEVRLEDAGGPILFLRSGDAEEYARSEDAPCHGTARIISVRVGYA
jgi:hypothetical protein